MAKLMNIAVDNDRTGTAGEVVVVAIPPGLEGRLAATPDETPALDAEVVVRIVTVDPAGRTIAVTLERSAGTERRGSVAPRGRGGG